MAEPGQTLRVRDQAACLGPGDRTHGVDRLHRVLGPSLRRGTSGSLPCPEDEGWAAGPPLVGMLQWPSGTWTVADGPDQP